MTTLLYIALLTSSALASVIYHPLVGLFAYLVTYNINPWSFWWGRSVPRWAGRYSLILGVATVLGIVLQPSKVKFQKLLESQEVLLLLFLLAIWLSIPFGIGPNEAESHALKMTKVVIAVMMGTHLVTDLKRYEMMIRVLIICAVFLALKVYTAPEVYFTGGRLDYGIGGSDFAEGNFLASHFAHLLPIIGIMFLKGRWHVKLLCLVSGAFVANGVVIARSRGVFLALIGGGIVAIILAYGFDKGKRRKLLVTIVAGLVGGILVTDPFFWERMKYITFETEKMDVASSGRIEAWKTALAMTKDHPLGIGEGNFKRVVGEYKPEIRGVDTHNTMLRCLAELGVHGLSLLLLLIFNAFFLLSSVSKASLHSENRAEFLWHVYAVKVALVVFLFSGIFITHTYIEEFYWLLMFPVFLKRAIQNELQSEGGMHG